MLNPFLKIYKNETYLYVNQKYFKTNLTFLNSIEVDVKNLNFYYFLYNWCNLDANKIEYSLNEIAVAYLLREIKKVNIVYDLKWKRKYLCIKVYYKDKLLISNSKTDKCRYYLKTKFKSNKLVIIGIGNPYINDLIKTESKTKINSFIEENLYTLVLEIIFNFYISESLFTVNSTKINFKTKKIEIYN